MRSGRAPASATSRHYAEPIPADDGGDYDLGGRDSNDLDEGYMHRVRPLEDMVRPAPVRGRRTSDMSMASIELKHFQKNPSNPKLSFKNEMRVARKNKKTLLGRQI